VLLEQIIEHLKEANQDANFINKLKILEEEADESQYSLELLLEINKLDNSDLNTQSDWLIKESNELVAIFVAIINKKQTNIKNKNSDL
jgi:four helix bundle protein